MVKVLGICGGSGSGKSTVTRIVEKKNGAEVIDADVLAHQIIKKGNPAYDEIISCYGSGIVGPDGEIMRKELGKIVFGSPSELKKLDNITYKYIYAEIVNNIESIRAKDKCSLIALDCALLLNTTLKDLTDEIWYIDADIELRIRRTMERDSISREYAQKRIKSQSFDTSDAKIKTIMNNEGFEELENNVNNLIRELML
ncbi:MAG TPA: dephospho-CoA kinase [Clostridia bacterium]